MRLTVSFNSCGKFSILSKETFPNNSLQFMGYFLIMKNKYSEHTNQLGG